MKISRINPFVLSFAILVIAAGIVCCTDRWDRQEYHFLPGVVVLFYSLWGVSMGIEASVTLLLRRVYDPSRLKWIFAGIWNLAVGLTYVIFCMSLRSLSVNMMSIPFLLNLLIGLSILLNLSFRKPSA